MRLEEERLKQVQERAEERIQLYETATQREQRMFGDTGTSSLQTELKDLGYTDDQIEEMDYKGIDIEAVNKYREERAAYEKQFGTAQTTQMFPDEDPTTLKQKLATGLGYLNTLFLEKQTITAPFQNKLDPNRENIGPQVYGKVQEFAGEMVTGAVDSLVRTIGLATAEVMLRTKAAFDPTKTISETEMQLPFSPGWVFNETDITPDNKIKPWMERSLDMLAELDRLSPDTPIKNNIITTLDQTVIPLLDATVVMDIFNLAARPLIVTVASKDVTQKYIGGRFIDGVESFKGVGARRVQVPVRTDTEQLLTAYQVLGWSRDDIAKIAQMTPYEQSRVFADRMRERASAILKNEYTPTPGAEGLAPQQTAPEMLEAMNALKREGSLTPQQEMELYRLNAAAYTVMGMQLKNGVVGIPKLMQFGVEMANVLAKPLRTYTDARTAFDRALRLRARAAGEEPFKFNIGLTIDDVSGGVGKKTVTDDVADNIDPIVKKFADDEYAGIEVAFDSNTNTLLVVEGRGRWEDLPPAAKAVIYDLARQQKVNFGYVDGIDPDIGVQPEEIEYAVRGFSEEEVAINQRIQAFQKEANDQRKAIEMADDAYVKEGLAPDDPLVQQIADLGINQATLIKTLEQIPQVATGRTVPNIISRQILNTPIEANITPNPIRRSDLPEGNATAKAIIDSNNGLIAQMADQARAVTSAADFVRRYAFLTDVTKVPDVRFRGTGIFTRLGTVEERIRDLVSNGVINREQIDSIKSVEIPSELVEMTPAFREPKLVQALEDVMPDMIEELVKGTPEGDMVRNFIYERYSGLRRITSSQINKPEEVLAALRADPEKPNIPFFVLTNQGRAVLISTNQPTFDVIAAAKMAGVETIPGYLIDLGGLAEMRAFLKENNMTLKDFALEARSFAPKVESGKKAKKPMTAEMREEAGLASGRLARVGTSEEFSIIIPTDSLVQPFPANEPILYNGLTVREQFDLAKLTPISEGSSRVNFEIGKNGILKVAKNPLGKIQNLMSYNIHAWRQGLTPNLFAGGDGWILTERHGALDGPALKHFEDFIDFYRVYATKNIDNVTNRPQEIDRILRSWLEGVDQTKIDELMYQAIEMDVDMSYMDVYFFEFLNAWRQSTPALTAVTKEGKPLYNWTEFSRYNVNLDILKEDSWGVRPDGTMVLIDEGSIYREALGALKSPNAEAKSWSEFFVPFEETFKKNKKVKEEMKRSDGHRFFSFTPLPYFEEDEETGMYNVDIWKSMIFTALGSVVVGGKELPFGGGKKKGKGKAKGTKTPVEKLREELLPQTTQGLPGPVKGALNADAFKAKTGEPFGGVFPQTANFKGITPQGIPSLDAAGEILPPLGDAGYVFLDNDVASNFNTDGKITHFISNADNPLVINTDKELRALAKAAGIQEPDIMQVTKAMNERNINMLREYIENAGFDGVVVAMDPRKGKIDLLDRYFEFNQFINFNKGNYKPATSPNTPTVTVTTAIKRSSKIQRQIMRAIDPPASILEIDEMKFLKKRLQLINRTIKEGKKLGWSEARVSIGNRLANLWEYRMEKADRNRKLSLLKQRILDREKLLVKREMTDYAKAMLPIKEDREYLAQRGKLIDNIANAETRTELQKAFLRIDRMRVDTEKKLLVSDIKKTVSRWADSPSVSADYRKMINEVFSEIDLTSRRPETIKRIAKMRDYINRNITAGDDVVITADMQKELELLFVKGIDQLSIGELKNFKAQIETLIELGKAKRRTYKDLQKLKRDRMLKEVQEEGTLPISNKEIDDLPANVGEELPKQQRFNNWWKEQQNKLNQTSKVIQPMDYFFDRLDGGKLTFDGPMYRAFRDGVNIRYNNFLEKNFKFQDEMIKLSESLGLKTGNFERIGVYMQARRPEGRKRLLSMGYTNKMIDDVELTPKEMEWATWADDVLDKERPILAKIARDVFNKEFNVLEDMFPMIADFKLMGEENYSIQDMFGDASAKLTGKRTKVKPGTIESRSPGAEGSIKINALDVIKQHMENTLYMEEMAEHIKLLGDMTNATKPVRKKVNGEMRTVSQNILEPEIGDLGLELTKAYVDVLARKGGAEGQQQMGFISWLNRNAGPAVLAFKLTSAMIQWTAIFNTAAVIGPRALGGLFEVTHSAQARKFVLDNMPQIKARIGDDIAFRNVADFTWLQKYNQVGWSGLQYLDRWTASGGAMGAYRKYLADHGIPFDWNKPNQEAILYAQRVVNTTQSSSDFKDAALSLSAGQGIVGKREINRIILKFQSFGMTDFQVYYNYFYRSAKGQTSRTKSQTAMALIAAMMAVIATIQTRRLGFQTENAITGRDNEDDRRLEDDFTTKAMQEVIQKFPFMAQAISVAVYESEPVPILGSVNRLFRGGWGAISGAFTGEFGTEQWFKDTISFTTGVTGLLGVGGSSQVQSSATAILEGLNEEPGDGGPEAPEPPKPPKPPKGPSN